MLPSTSLARALLIGVSAATCLLAVACSKDEKRLPAPPEAALWAAFGTSENDTGFGLRLEPGVDGEAWVFDISGYRLICPAARTDEGWHFEGCTGLPSWLFGFQADVSATDGEPMTVSLDLAETDLTTKLARVPNRDEPVKSENVELVWDRPTDASCSSRSGVWAEDGLVFAPCFSGIIEILDAATGALKSRATLRDAPGGDFSAVLEVTARDGILYAATTNKGVVAFDVRDPEQPRFLGSFYHDDPIEASPDDVTNIHTLTLSPDGKLLFAINQSHPRSDIRIIDVSDPANMRQAGIYLPRTSSRAFGFSHDLSLEERDGKLIGYYYQLAGGLHILDVSDPANVQEAGALNWPRTLSHSGWPFAANGKRYLAHMDEGYDQGMTVIDVTNVAEPSIVSTYKTRDGISIHNIRVIDRIAFISYYVDGLRIVDLHDPAHPREIGHYDTVPPAGETGIWEGAWGVHVDGGLIYISDRSSGVYAFRFTEAP